MNTMNAAETSAKSSSSTAMQASMAAALILAAGKGTRMKSDNPKCLFPICGVPMADIVGRNLKAAGIEKPILVIGHRGELLQDALGEQYTYVWQHEQKGTGHAAMMATEALAEFDGPVMVAPGDMPLLGSDDYAALINLQVSTGAACSMAVCTVADPTGYGRIVRNDAGDVVAIVEHKDCNEEQLLLNEMNPAVYCFDSKTLFRLLPTLGNNNAQGEYYLTDMIAAIVRDGGQIVTHSITLEAAMGVNDRWQLGQAAQVVRHGLLEQHAKNGVSIVDPATTYVDMDVKVGRDTVLEPMTQLMGRTTIGVGCTIGPSTKLVDVEVHDGASICMSMGTDAIVRAGAKVGPFAHLRPKADIGEQAKVGNFVEVKNARLGTKVSAGHLAYLGDAEIGDKTNIGAGTITCNYDGFEKHKTEIGSGVFVGSNSTLVAPVVIQSGSFVAAGSVINRTVPEDSLAIGRARQEVKEQWAQQWRERKRKDRNE